MEIRRRESDLSVAEAMSSPGLPVWLAKLYASRGVKSAGDVAAPLTNLPVPASMLNLEAMASEIVRLHRGGRRLLVVGDYDCDGATASAVLTRGLAALGIDIDFLVPKRLEHGYGLTPEVVRQAATRGPDALLTVDCGISSFDGIAEARALGLPVFVTDHHLPGESLPEAELIVNPNQHGCTFPTRTLCGAGVALYLVRAVRDAFVRGGMSRESLPNIRPLLGWVAIGTIADVVPLDATNRSLVAAGLHVLRAGRAGPGVQALIDVAKKFQPLLSTQDIAFGLGPRINAAGRMSTMDAGVNLLMDNGASASRLAHELDALNMARREVEAEMAKVAAEQAEALVAEDGRVTLVACHEGWHEGVIGIVAGRLKEKHWRPTVVLAPMENGNLKGSARSIPGLHLRDCLARVDQLYPGVLVKFGGHAAAAGLTLNAGCLDVFTAAFEAVARGCLSSDDLRRVVLTDGELPAEALTLEGATLLNDGLWGQGMPAPLFMDEVRVLHKRQLRDRVTNEPRHLKLSLSVRGVTMDAIWFNQPDLDCENPVLLYTLGVNEYKGTVSSQLVIEGRADV